jgi:hypothetical protein
MLSKLSSIFITNEVKLSQAINEFSCGMVYSRLAYPEAPVDISLLLRNAGFILSHIPFAARKATAHYDKAAQICKECGYNGLLGKVHLEQGLLYQKKGKKEQARGNLSACVKLCRESEDAASLKQAEALLTSL